MHQGIDLVAEPGTPVLAAADGVVTGAAPNGGYGNWIEIQHEDKLSTVYGHLAAFAPGIAAGVHVQKGDTILWHPQLPHGGAPIRDLKRSRLSLVMHTTPRGVPVYHQDAFFNPARPFPTTAPWTYKPFQGRLYASHGAVSFGHVVDYPLETFTHAGC